MHGVIHTNDNQKHNYLNKMSLNVKCHVEDCGIVNLQILVNPKIIRLFVFTSKICTFHNNYIKYPITFFFTIYSNRNLWKPMEVVSAMK